MKIVHGKFQTMIDLNLELFWDKNSELDRTTKNQNRNQNKS